VKLPFFGKKQGEEQEPVQEKEREPFRWVSTEEARKMLESGQVQLIDVRESWEYKSGHIPGARLVPLNTFLRQPKQFVPGDSARLMFVCAVGERSAVACEMAAAVGCKEVYNISGGTSGWMAKGYPIEQ
jgi:rhodanese-related sulfurtransferase